MTGVGENVQFGCPELKLSLPVGYGAERGADKEWAFKVTLLNQKQALDQPVAG